MIEKVKGVVKDVVDSIKADRKKQVFVGFVALLILCAFVLQDTPSLIEHSGKWRDRGRMAWAGFFVGSVAVLGDTFAPWVGAKPAGTAAQGAAIITLIIMTMVVGKVAHDRFVGNLGKEDEDTSNGT